ncbi:MAG TPA: MMPL family transporter [Solirubrobacteraceae bacterium]|nr:MMPL family transporter [Solirubrobacteraceae bacterium]
MAWLAGLLVCSLISAAEPGNITDNGFSVPGSGSARAEDLVRHNFPGFSGPPIIVVLTSSLPGTRLEVVKPEWEKLKTVGKVLDGLHGVEVIERVEKPAYYRYDKTHIRTIVADLIRMSEPLAIAVQRVPEIETRLRRASPKYVEFTLLGEVAETYRDSAIIHHDITRAEFVALPIVFGLLVVAFLSVVAAILPIVLAVAVLICTLAFVHLVSLAFGLSIFAVNTATSVALGLSIDYSLIVVTRFREEQEDAGSVHLAIERAMNTAGRTVFLSGLTIAALLPALMLIGVGLFSSIALGGAIASLFAVFAATTLLPAMLVLLGDRVDRLSFRPAVTASRRGTVWRRLAGFVTTHPLTAALVSSVVLLVLATPALSLRLDFRSTALSPAHSVAARGEADIEAAYGPGSTGLVEIVTRDAGGVRSILASATNVHSIWGERAGRAGWTEMDVVLWSGPHSNATQVTVNRLRREFDASPSTTAYVGGVAAGEIDLANRVLGRLPIVVLAVCVVGLIMLVLGLKSIVIPIKAMVCSALSVGATLGLLEACFPSSGEGAGIAFFVPVVTFALVLGLSIDYEVFLLSRVREMARQNGDVAVAVSYGLTRTARPITLAGLVVAAVFSAFSFSSLTAVQELGVAVTIGIALDIGLVRWLLSPACVVLAGRWNWWFPRRCRRS